MASAMATKSGVVERSEPRWIHALDDDAQLLLLAAHRAEVEDELGVRCEHNKVTPLLQGSFPEHEDEETR